MSLAALCAHCGGSHGEGARFCPFTGKSLEAGADPRLGTLVGGHRIEEVIGAGAHGTVYAARAADGAEVAIKIVHLDAAHDRVTAIARFGRETRATLALRHPNIARVSEAGVLADGTPWLAMERIQGETLRARMQRDGRLAIADAVAIASSLLDALDAAHAHDIVHRDVKPENVLLAHEGERVVPKLVDFGLARDRGAAITKPGSVLGTPWYLAPELARGRASGIDGRVDLWSVGVVLYEMLTGRRPFEGADLVSLFVAILGTTPPSPRTLRPEISEALAEGVMRALEKDPAQRFSSAREMRVVLRVLAVAPSGPGALPLELAPTVAGGIKSPAGE